VPLEGDEGASGTAAPGRDLRSLASDVLPALLLAAIGLLGAVAAWRVATAGSVSGDADRAALAAARTRAASEVAAEQQIAQTTAAWLDFERSERRADALDAGGFHEEALQERQVATAHWFLVRPEYLGRDDVYEPERHRSAELAAASSRYDIDPAPHEQEADREYARISDLLVAALVIVLALPLATLAEVSRGRWRLGSAMVGSVILTIGVALLSAAWI
jgi:hypothetical protein